MCALCDYVHVSSKKVKKLVRIHILQLCRHRFVKFHAFGNRFLHLGTRIHLEFSWWCLKSYLFTQDYS